MTASRNFFGLLLSVVIALSTLEPERPEADYHEHLLSPSVARILSQPKPFRAVDLIAEMNAAGIRRAVIPSLAYQFGNPQPPSRKG